mmetsp:Transcript_41330/g.62457  ORF Transcript_41330/g.62457 Transcript_41330/m.62457 type:complete len:352 (-) Transcript_41330:72-1127(-)|eukprot:CAMPEP_0194755950 /NCGR_PEP_ID=MMETSP0323_2-20130528/9731_1 /TAXON_ID=2866 ORGANISM="Crypthecodinium cohnii, Strain Seligo" /NCGR_SAMPLE_ID=MMETSP0323_2 /ASSEMBLY_ACC=CAM_ASM_000346 /LENGTH=351 /DNA_ID=CAMNT_0039675249 /DNA_START=153 /DNA_END=1208 /DNA_ORIENTATION=+
MSSAAKQLEIVRSFEAGNDVRQIIASSENGRALKLLKQREETKTKADAERAVIENETRKRKLSSIDQKFGGSSADHLEEVFKTQSIGLVSVEEWKARRRAIDDLIQEQQQQEGKKKMRLNRQVNANKLSFDQEDDDSDSGSGFDDDDVPASSASKKLGKNPTVDTSFLFDKDREAELERKKRELIAEYNEAQEKAKNEQLEITYSYWDGSGHRRSTVVEKGYSIGQFLAKAKAELEKSDFPELRTVPTESLMYVKEDLIIPHNVTFHNLIQSKARGKSGPLFHFDVHDDIRINSDVRVEKDESHAGKIVDKKWYERSKHIFPASRWVLYSKDKTYETYTIHGENDHSVPIR